MKHNLIIIFFLNIILSASAQDPICINKTIGHFIQSKYMDEERAYWVSLPLKYSDSKEYPVIYVFDAEWRFGLVKDIVFDLGGNDKIQKSIVLGIPHIEMDYKRGQDLTFSHSRVEYDGEPVDLTWYNDTNSGSGMKFYSYLIKELIPDVNKNYSTNGHETLIGHSYGGYFGAFMLSLDHPFEIIHMYDPSIWYGNGEVTVGLKASDKTKEVKIHINYQPEPDFHRKKIEQFIDEVEKRSQFILTKDFYPNETHNSLFLDSFYKGILQTNNSL